MVRKVKALTLASLLLLFVGCGDETATKITTPPGSDAGSDAANGWDVHEVPDVDEPDVDEPDVGEPDVSEPDVGPDLGQIGDTCEADLECASEQCVEFGAEGDAICTEECESSCDVDGLVCFEGLCTPEDFCDDSAGEGYGEGPGCIGAPCDLCGENANCVDDEEGSYTCECMAGYAGDGVTCTDIDECATGASNCDQNATCTNTPGGFTCECEDGYEGDGESCVDIDECATGADNCDENATCSNTPGGFVCTCSNGFEGDGVSCADVDECATNTHTCDENAECTNSFGGFTCECADGFEGDGNTCADIDECATNAHDCDANATCSNTPGSFTCECATGYEGDGNTCADIDECATNTHTCDENAICTNTPGGFTCECATGYEGDGNTCADIDECATNAHDCDQNATCTNTPGSFTCECSLGYSGDGNSCLAFASCAEYLAHDPSTVSGSYFIDPSGEDRFEVYCDMDTDGGGWTSLIHHTDLLRLNFSVPHSEVAVSSGTRFWVIEERVIGATYSYQALHERPDTRYVATGLTLATTGWLWNGDVAWINPGTCHLGQDVNLVQNTSEHPRSFGNPHYNTGQSMPTSIQDAAITTASTMDVAEVTNYAAFHIGCVGYNVLTDPIVWVR